MSQEGNEGAMKVMIKNSNRVKGLKRAKVARNPR